MKFPPSAKLKQYLKTVNRWLPKTADRALEDAYDAALTIKAIEDEHFGGNKISADSGSYGQSVMSYFQAEQSKYLRIVQKNLEKFLQLTQKEIANAGSSNARPGPSRYSSIDIRDKPAIVLEKLEFIDEVLGKYSINSSTKQSTSVSLISVSQNKKLDVSKVKPQKAKSQKAKSQDEIWQQESAEIDPTTIDIDPNARGISDQTSFLPRSILKTINRIKRELDPKAEKEVIKTFRSSKTKTFIALRFVLILILVPLLTQQLSKNFLVGPIVDLLRGPARTEIFLNLDLETEAFEELQRFQSELEFKNLVLSAPDLSDAEIQQQQAKTKQQMKSKALELAKEYGNRSSNAIKNIFSDLLSLLAFGLVVFTRRQDVVVLKSFMDEIIYGLSDSAKAFIIILFTDTFVGYHSPHGWEVILEGLSRHLGLPENRGFIYLFIATFPVILDTVLKYWIFRYLNRISPSAVATYRNMNE